MGDDSMASCDTRSRFDRRDEDGESCLTVREFLRLRDQSGGCGDGNGDLARVVQLLGMVLPILTRNSTGGPLIPPAS